MKNIECNLTHLLNINNFFQKTYFQDVSVRPRQSALCNSAPNVRVSLLPEALSLRLDHDPLWVKCREQDLIHSQVKVCEYIFLKLMRTFVLFF